MKDSLLLGFRRLMIPVPRFLWQGHVRSGAHNTRAHLASLPDEHTVIHYFCVSELPRVGMPLSPVYIAEKLHLTLDRVTDTLEYLEQRMTFLYRNTEGAVAWAYPVTADETPHRITFDSGEQIHAA
jgi:hypothetical protein